MQILNNPSKVIFEKPLTPKQQQRRRGSSNHGQKGNPHIIFDRPSSKHVINEQNQQKGIHIPKKVSFHYSNGKQQQTVLNYPPNPPFTFKIQPETRDRRFSGYSQKSNEIQNQVIIRSRINSMQNRSSISQNSAQQRMNNSGLLNVHKKQQGLNYPPQKVVKQHTSVQYDFPRQRTESGISSKSSKKIIVQTVRKINPDGTKGEPIQIKERVQTQYLTNLTNQQQQRSNYHIIQGQNAPKHIIVNHNYHSPQTSSRPFYSPQNPPIIFVDRQHQVINSGHITVNQTKTIAKQSTASKAKFSQVFTYPVRNSGDEQVFLNRKIMQASNSNYTASGQQSVGGFPITTQSKFQNINKDRNISKIVESPQQSSAHQNNMNQSFPIQNSSTINSQFINIKQTTYRGYGADLTKEPIKNQNDLTSKNNKYAYTTQFVSISQRLIDEIFRNETQKAILKLNTIEGRSSPKKYHSPEIRTYRHYRSTSRNKYAGNTIKQVVPGTKRQETQEINKNSKA